MENKKTKKKKNKNYYKNKEENSEEKSNINNSKNDKVKYFLMIPFEQENFISTFNTLCTKLEKENPPNFNKNLFQKPQKLHFTLLVLDINENKEKTEKIINIINNLISDIKNIASDELIFNFDKFDVFDTVKNAKVIFAKMIEDENHYKLKLITNLIIKKLMEGNILNKKDLQNLHINEEYNDGELIYVIKFHLTLLNVKYLNRFFEQEKKPTLHDFNATDILQCMKDIKFPECKLDKINLCAMRENPSNGKYEVLHTFNIL
jgi:2'-5' RNA ligase